MTRRIRAAATSSKGRRSNNEDTYELAPELGLFTVADGMGGYVDGEVASRTAVEVIRDFVERNEGDGELTWPYKLDEDLSFGENLVRVAIRLADEAITAQCRRNGSRMGTTVVAVVEWGGEGVLAHVGDSRIYRYREGTLEQLTRDHSFVNELEGADVDVDKMAAAHGHVITRALGAGADGAADPEVARTELQAGDRFLLCSDGVHDVLSEATLADFLASTDLEEAPEELTRAALEAGTTDNVTAMVLEVVEERDA